VIDLGWFFILFAVLVIIGAGNSVNLTTVSTASPLFRS